MNQEVFSLVHLALLALGWSVLLPSGIYMALFERRKMPNWYRLHQALNCTAASFIIIAHTLSFFIKDIGVEDERVRVLGQVLFVWLCMQLGLGAYILYSGKYIAREGSNGSHGGISNTPHRHNNHPDTGGSDASKYSPKNAGARKRLWYVVLHAASGAVLQLIGLIYIGLCIGAHRWGDMTVGIAYGLYCVSLVIVFLWAQLHKDLDKRGYLDPLCDITIKAGGHGNKK